VARPRSADKRSAILEAATRVVAAQGLSAPTALIAQEAGVANGSLFTYFETKADIFNQLYLELKTEVASTALSDLPTEADPREQLLHFWSRTTEWAAANPDKPRALAQLELSEEITPETRADAHKTMAPLGSLFELIRTNGPLREAPADFAVAIFTALTTATIDCMIHEPDRAGFHCKTGFEAFWRAVGGALT
jgi:AcrR family transcriptional regulator